MTGDRIAGSGGRRPMPATAGRPVARTTAVSLPAASILAASLLAGPGLLLPGTAHAQDTVRIGAEDPGRWGDTLEAVEELRIGSLTGAEHETFGLITDLAVTEDGTIWVADYQVPVIRRYDPRGRYLGSVGREGEGPGEYRQPIDLEVRPDGSLALWDFGNRRIGVYGTDGSFRGSHRVPTGGLYAGKMFFVDTAGGSYVRAPLRSAGGASEHGLLEFAGDGALVDTVWLPDREGDGVLGFPRRTLFAWSPYRALVVGRNAEYSFTIRRADGDSLTVIRAIEAVPVKNGERQWWEARAERRERRSARRGRGIEIPPVPGDKPAFRGLEADEEGRIWVHRHVEAERFEAPGGGEGDAPETVWRERPTFDVYARDGTFLGTAVLSYRTRRIVSRGRTVWGVRRGEYDESYVVRLRLEAEAGGLGRSR